MASFLRLQRECATDPIRALFEAINAADGSRQREAAAAARIQSVVRMRRDRLQFRSVVAAVVAVQRAYRGYIARRATVVALIERERRRQALVFDYYATLIQSRFRGFISRKKMYSYYAQRRYVADVVAKSEAVRAEAAAALEHQLQAMEAARQAHEREAYEKSLLNRHHLLSTATVSGVLRPPLTERGLRTVFGTHVEEDLRHATGRKFKPDLPTTTNHAKASTATTSAPPPVPADDHAAEAKASSARPTRNWGRTVLDQPPPLSIYAGVPYARVEEQERYDRSLSKAVAGRMHDESAFAVRRPAPPKVGISVLCQTPYAGPVAATTRTATANATASTTSKK